MNFIPFVFFSCLTLFCFITLGIGKFGLLNSYSSYAAKWHSVFPVPNMNLWSIITFIAAAILVPVMVELGEGSSVQFLGFFTPVYLIFVSFTPKWATDDSQFKMHVVCAALCALCAFLYIIFVLNKVWILITITAIVLLISLLSKTLKSSLVFWLEMIMFSSTYIALIL